MIRLIRNIRNYLYPKELLVFINFKGNKVPYGGGNTFVENLNEFLLKTSVVRVTYNLQKGIDIYLIVDIRKGKYKKYSFVQIKDHKTKNKKGKIIIRINDCDITRQNKTIEVEILKYIDDINHFVFNSNFIKSYYFDKYPQLKLKSKTVIYNSSNSNYFYPNLKKKLSTYKIKIITHHWSDNLNKGYEFYYKLHNYCVESENLEFKFIGRKFHASYDFNESTKLKIHGPYQGKKLADEIRECHIYITASVYDACPMHVLEGLSCGLPILYINHEGGGKELCELSNQKVGESFSDFDELLVKLNLILDNYEAYIFNIRENIALYNSDKCYSEFYALFRSYKDFESDTYRKKIS